MSHLADTGAVVVHYRNYELIGPTLLSLIDQGLPASNIVVVDTSEEPAKREALRALVPSGAHVMFVANRGYGSGVNAGLDYWSEVSALDPTFMLVATHEVLPQANAIRELRLALVQDKGIAAAGPTLLCGVGESTFVWSRGGRLSPRLGLPQHHGHRDALVDVTDAEPEDRQWLDGAFVLYRTEALASNRFNEDFFMYMEETDLHLRLQREGYRLSWVPTATVWQSSNGVPPFYFARNLRMLYEQSHRSALGRVAVPVAVGRRFLSEMRHGRAWASGRALAQGSVSRLPHLRGGKSLRPLTVLNPLGSTLDYYTRQLARMVEDNGALIRHRTVFEPSATNGSRIGWLISYVRELVGARREHKGSGAVLLVTWPVIGYLDIVLIAIFFGGQSWLVVHDPSPLVRAVGYDRFSRALASLFSRKVGLIVHSYEAQKAVLARNASFRLPAVLPHPLFPPLPKPVQPTQVDGDLPIVRVLGQYKKDRNLAALREIGDDLAGEVRLEIWGRGWPNLNGWNVQEGFVTEDEMEALILSADVIVIPYKKFFQSGIAIRSVEHGIPVVGPKSSSLTEMFGSDSRLLADDGRRRTGESRWAEAVRWGVTSGRPETASAGQRLWAKTDRAWAAWIQNVLGARRSAKETAVDSVS
jgi:GT2 family glycosyltransferase